MKILLSGSLTYDYIMTIPGRLSDHILPEQISKLNLSLLANTFRKGRGGTAGNIAYTMSLLETKPEIVGVIGYDGTDYLSTLERQGINTKKIRVDAKSLTSSAFIVSDESGGQISSYYGNVSSSLAPNLKEIKNKIDLAVISPSRNLRRYMRECAKLNIKTIFDPGQISTSLSKNEYREFINSAYGVIVNEYESEVTCQKSEWSLSEIKDKLSFLIITKGKEGSTILRSKEKDVQIKVCKPKVVCDPTGAGDAYRGALLAGMARNFDLETCAKMGSIAGAYCVEKPTAQEHKYTIPEFCARYKNTYRKEINM